MLRADSAPCPVCNRVVQIVEHGLPGWPNRFIFHYDRQTGRECLASRKSAEHPGLIREEQDAQRSQIGGPEQKRAANS